MIPGQDRIINLTTRMPAAVGGFELGRHMLSDACSSSEIYYSNPPESEAFQILGKMHMQRSYIAYMCSLFHSSLYQEPGVKLRFVYLWRIVVNLGQPLYLP